MNEFIESHRKVKVDLVCSLQWVLGSPSSATIIYYGIARLLQRKFNFLEFMVLVVSSSSSELGRKNFGIANYPFDINEH